MKLTKNKSEPRKAFESVQDELDAMHEEDVTQVRGVTGWDASTIVIGAVASAQVHMEALEEVLPMYKPVRLKRLTKLALALRFTVFEEETRDNVQAELRDEARELRNVLGAHYEALRQSGLLPEIVLMPGRSDQALLTTLGRLAEVFWLHGSEIEGKTAVTMADIKRAHALVSEITARKEQAPPPYRRRLLALLDEEYAELRHAITYLRRYHGDAATITPVLRSTKKTKAKAKPEEPEESEGMDPVATPVAEVTEPDVPETSIVAEVEPTWHADAHAGPSDEVPEPSHVGEAVEG